MVSSRPVCNALKDARAALVLLALLALSAEHPAFAARAAHAARKPAVTTFRQDDGSLFFQARTYQAVVGIDGNLHSIRIGDTQMLDDTVAISLGCFFYADGPRRLERVRQRGQTALEATDGTYSIRYRFDADAIRLTLMNAGSKPAPYFVVLSPAIAIAARPGGAEAAAVPANERWGAVRFTAPTGAYIELSGGTRIWGPWLESQVWEVSQVPPGGSREVRISAGQGQPPRATLSQLVGLRAKTLPDSGIVEESNPIYLTVTLDNRSGQPLKGDLSVELSASRGDLVIFSNSPVELPALHATDKEFHWQVDRPDFYALRVTALSGGREISQTRAVAGYDPSKIRPQVDRPEDFDAFWKQLAEDADSQPQYSMTRDERLSRKGVDVWVVRYQSLGGKTIHGWYAAPADARRLPAILYLSGYGARRIDPPVGFAGHGWAVLAIDVRGNRVDRTRPRSFEDYCTNGIDSPQTYVYREIVGHALRGLQFLRSRDEVDPDRIAIVGVSEGAGVGLLAAGLSPSVSAVAADAPMLVDFPLSLRSAGWPYSEIVEYESRHPATALRIPKTLSYFDVVNIAPQIRCPVLLSIGLLDQVSLPAAVYGLYNVLPGPKDIRTFPQAGHEGGGEDHWTYTLDWLSKAIASKPEPVVSR